MSRIHEALKKAAKERGAEITSTAAASPAQSAEASGSQSSFQSRADIEVRPLSGPNGSPAPSGTLSVEELGNRCAKANWRPDISKIVFADSAQAPMGVEEFLTLRSRLYRIREKQPLRTLLVTSAIPGEGKSFVASNLAYAITRQSERRSLLIDSDLRCPQLHVSLGAPKAPGLSDYLEGIANELAVVQRGTQDNLFFISCGKAVPNPMELISNGRLRLLLDHLAHMFDWIILDSPPALPVSDAQVLSGACDGVLVVTRAASTPFTMSQRACQEFRNRNLIGVVLNGADQRETYGSYYYSNYPTDVGRKG